MFTLQIDTARSWRGGQNQVLLTARGLRARGHRVVVVAHPEGELRQRVGGRGRGRCRSRRAARSICRPPGGSPRADPRAAAGRRPRARPPRRRRGRGGAVRSASARAGPLARRRAPGRLPPQGQLVLALEVPAGGLLHRLVGRHPRDADRATASRPSGRSRSTRAWTSTRIAAIEPARPARGVLVPRPRRSIVGNVAALVPHKGQKYLIDAAADRRSRGPARALRHPRRRRTAAAPRAPDPAPASRAARGAGRVPRRTSSPASRPSTSS